MTKEELLRFAKNTVIDTIQYNLGDLYYKYLLRSFNIPEDCIVELKIANKNWSENFEIIEIDDQYYKNYTTIPLLISGDLLIKKNFEIINTYPNINFKFIVEFWLNFNAGTTSFHILDEDNQKIKNYIFRIENINDQRMNYSINSDQILFNGKNHSCFFTEITRKPRQNRKTINDYEILDDITRCSIDIKYLIGELLLLKPYTRNYLSQKVIFYEKPLFQYFPTYIDKRYFLISGLLLELFYNYWDKIGDLLAIYYTPEIPEKKIFFPIVIENITNESINFKWLKDFANKEYKDLNGKRKQVVHYKNIESDFIKEYMDNIQNEESLKELQLQKDNMTEFFENHLRLTISGFEKACLFIDEIE